MTNSTCDWPGATGKSYTYYVHPISELNTFNPNQAGNYIFAKLDTNNLWDPVYVGQTEDFKERFGDHEKLLCATRNGATHIHLHINNSAHDRIQEETDIRHNFTTPCNMQ
ncbi:hypothetical protein JD969_14710 [Planctomycetota bacterium]|nr:hypothetical protein JD969_14710 [Planctomycetota bacterium]